MKKSLNINIILSCVKTVTSLLFPLITFPYITRVLSPDGVGKYNYSNSIVSYFVLLAGLGIGTYAIREGSKIRENKEKFNIFASEVILLNLISMVVSYLILFLCVFLVNKLYVYKEAILLCSISIVFTTLGMDWVYTIYEEYVFVTLRAILSQILSIICLFVFVHNEGDVYIYILIHVFSTAFSNVLNMVCIRRYFRFRIVKIRDIMQHIKPVLLIFALSISSAIYVNSDMTMLGWISGTEQVGYYTVASKMYNIIKMVLNSLVMVFIARLSNYYENNRKLYNSTFKYAHNIITTILIPLFVGSLLFSDVIIIIISGEEYLVANSSMKILFFSLIFAVCGNLYSTGGLLIARLERYILVATSLGAIMNLILNAMFIPKMGCLGASVSTAITELCICIYIFILYQKKIDKQLEIKHIMKCIIASLFMIIVKGAGVYLHIEAIQYQLLLLFICVVIYFIGLILLKDNFIWEILKKIKQKYK